MAFLAVNPKSSNFRAPDAHFREGGGGSSSFGPGGEEKGFPAGVTIYEPEAEEEGVPAEVLQLSCRGRGGGGAGGGSSRSAF